MIAPEDIELLSDSVQDIEDGQASWLLKGAVGEYLLEYEFDDDLFVQEIIITDNQKYSPQEVVVKNNNLKKLLINYNKKTYIFGIGWLWSYIIFSIVFNMVFRKLFKLH